MTDNKRFIDDGFEAIEEQSFTDVKTGKTYYVDYFDDIIDLLNKLNDENEELKQRYDVQRDFYAQLNSNYNNLYDEYKELKSIILNLFNNITELDWIREEYCNGVLGLFEKAESLDEARLMIKEYLE